MNRNQEHLPVIASMIKRCEDMIDKFQKGTSQHTLLYNRIHALNIAHNILNDTQNYTSEEIQHALAPINSIIHKCEKAQSKYEKETSNYKRFHKTLQAVHIAHDAMVNAMQMHIRKCNNVK